MRRTTIAALALAAVVAAAALGAGWKWRAHSAAGGQQIAGWTWGDSAEGSD